MVYENNPAQKKSDFDLKEGQIRVAAALLSEAKNPERNTSISGIARLLGFTASQVNESLHSLRTNDMIEMKRGCIIVKDKNIMRHVFVYSHAQQSS